MTLCVGVNPNGIMLSQSSLCSCKEFSEPEKIPSGKNPTGHEGKVKNKTTLRPIINETIGTPFVMDPKAALWGHWRELLGNRDWETITKVRLRWRWPRTWRNAWPSQSENGTVESGALQCEPKWGGWQKGASRMFLKCWSLFIPFWNETFKDNVAHISFFHYCNWRPLMGR